MTKREPLTVSRFQIPRGRQNAGKAIFTSGRKGDLLYLMTPREFRTTWCAKPGSRRMKLCGKLRLNDLNGARKAEEKKSFFFSDSSWHLLFHFVGQYFSWACHRRRSFGQVWAKSECVTRGSFRIKCQPRRSERCAILMLPKPRKGDFCHF